MLTKINIKRFTAFDDVEVKFSKGINVLIGANGTGKTHLMKFLYGMMKFAEANNNQGMDQILMSLFLPDSMGRLVKRTMGRSKGILQVCRIDDDDSIERTLRYELSSLGKSQTINSRTWTKKQQYNVVYVPVKDMLANSPGFKSLYDGRYLYFESIYADIVSQALLPATRGHASGEKSRLLDMIQDVIDGRVEKKNEKFYLKNPQGNLEFTLLAEGYRKLGLLFSLIQNESISSGSILFWDEPEANLNPMLAQKVISIILELQRMGTQVFISTHDYVFLKELELARKNNEDLILYHSLYRDGDGVKCQSDEHLSNISQNTIFETFDRLVIETIGSQWED